MPADSTSAERGLGRRFLALVTLAALSMTLVLLGTVRPAGADGTGGKVAGMVLSSFGQHESPDTAMSRMKADGINTVSLFVWWWADQPSSTALRPYDGTESDADLVAQVQAAHANGLKVILTPIFDCGTCQGGWRGVMQPSDVPAFFASYRAFMNHYAQLAQANGVWLLFIGSEMTDLEPETAQWQSVISGARQYYSGQIGYEQNWDVVAHPQFLGNVDVVGVSAYFPLDDAPDPSEAQLLGDWSNSQGSIYKGRNWVDDVLHLANVTGKPILFGEVGYMASDNAARQPFSNGVTNSNPTLQANLYEALLQAFSGRSWWMGASWWEWSDASVDQQRTPAGKPAESLLQNWYVNGWRPPVSGTGAPADPAGGTLGSSGATPAPIAAAGAFPVGSAGPVPSGSSGSPADGPGSPGSPGSAISPGSAVAPGSPGSAPGPSVSSESAPAPVTPGPATDVGSRPQADGTILAAAAADREGSSPSRHRSSGPTVVAVVLLAAAGGDLIVALLRPKAAARRRRPSLPYDPFED